MHFYASGSYINDVTYEDINDFVIIVSIIIKVRLYKNDDSSNVIIVK